MHLCLLTLTLLSCQPGFRTVVTELPSLQSQVPDTLRSEHDAVVDPTQLLTQNCDNAYSPRPYSSNAVIVLPIVSAPGEELNYSEHFGQVYESLKFSSSSLIAPLNRKLPELPVSFNYYPDQFNDPTFKEKLIASYPNQGVSAYWLNFSMTIETLLDSENNHPKPFLRPSSPCTDNSDPNQACATIGDPPDEVVFLIPDTSQPVHLCHESFALPFKFKFQEGSGFNYGKVILESPYYDANYGRLVYIWMQLPDSPTWYQIGYFWRHDERLNLSSFNSSGRTPSSITEPTHPNSIFNRALWMGLSITALILLFGVTYVTKSSHSDKDV